MKIKLITLDHLEGIEIDTKNLLSVRFELSKQPENWIDITPYDNGIAVRSSPILHIFPQAANAINIFTASIPAFIKHHD